MALDAMQRVPWKRVLMISGAVVGVFLVLLVAINVFLSASWVQSRVAARIKEQTGRDLRVDGFTLLLFTPSPHIIITRARIADPDAKAGTADVSIEKLTLDLNFSELFSSQIDAERLVLVRPVLTIRLGDDTETIRFGDVEDKEPKAIRFAKADVSGGGQTLPRDIRLKDVRIEDGAVAIVYDNEDPSAVKRIENINARLTLPAITARLVGQGKFDWKNQTVNFSFEVRTPADLRAKRPAQFLLALDTPAIAARFDGKLTTKPDLAGYGELSAKARSIPAVLAWMRESPPVATALGDGELASDVSWTKSEIKFSNARFALEHLDLNPFLANAKKKKKTEDVASVRKAAPDAQPSATANDGFAKPSTAEVEKVIAPPPPAAVANADAPKSAPTSDPRLARVAPAAAFDADVNLNIRKTRVAHLEIGPSSLGLAMRDGMMNATLGGMELYGGHASGKIAIDATKPVPTFSSDLRLDGVQAKPFLSDAAQFSMIAGRTKLTLQLSGKGDDADDIKSSLRGQGSVVVSDGSLEGIDITGFISALGRGDFDLRQGPEAKTAFSDLGGSFTISDGIAETHNLKMVSPLLKVMADGTVDLARGNLDILAHPEIIEGPEGKTGANDLAGLSVPVRIEGPLDSPRIKPQFAGILANPDGASKTVNKIGEAIQKKFKGKPMGEAIDRLLGNVQIGGAKDKPAPEQPGQQSQSTPQAEVAPQAPPTPAPGFEQGDTSDDAVDQNLEDILR